MTEPQVDGRTCILVMKQMKTFIIAPAQMVFNLVCPLQKSTVIVVY